jgi:predicted RNA binding protein YcfA (HicA-like mRNA interferase family)
LPKLRKVSGKAAVKILCNKFGFEIRGKSGSHVRLSKVTPEGKVGTVIPMHDEIKIGTLKGLSLWQNGYNSFKMPINT